MTPVAWPRRPARLLCLVAVLSLLLTACERPAVQADADAESVALPEWLDRVYPEPGQEVSVTADVQVEHLLSEPDEGIRLLLDGTDVTSYAEEGRGLLVYDPDRSTAPQVVELGPGQHSATAERVRLDPATGAIEDTVDTFSWDFSIL